MEIDPTIEMVEKILHAPEYDYDHKEITIGHETDIKTPYPTTWLITRGASLAMKESSLRKLAHLEIQSQGMIVSLRDLRPEDLRKIARFLTDYSYRIRDFN